MNVIFQGEPQTNKYHGQCHQCKALVECYEDECITATDGKKVARCPTPHCMGIIMLIPDRWQVNLPDPDFKREEWYVTPIVPPEKK